MSEQILESRYDLGCLRRPKGKSRHCAVHPSFFHAESMFHIWNDILRQFSSKVTREKDCLLIIFKCVTAAHNHDHILAFTFCNEIIHNKIEFAVPQPACLILSHSMLDIHDRILLICIFSVRRWQIDITFLYVIILC